MTVAAPRAQLSSATNPSAPSTPTEEPTATTRQRPGPNRRLVLGLVAGVALVVGGGYYLSIRGFESTDDAQVDAEVVPVPARTGGTIAKVYFHENDSVKAGALLVELDDAVPKAKLAQAEANLAAAEAAADAADADERVASSTARGGKAMADASLQAAFAGATSAKDQIIEARAAESAAQASLAQARLDHERTQKLVESGSLAKSALDQSDTALSLAEANAAAARARLATLQSGVAQASGRVSEASARAQQSKDVDSVIAQAGARAKSAHAQVATARAARDLAAVELSYTKIIAPHDGVISKKSIAEGQALSAGQTIAQLVTPGVWVTANFKETQLGKVRPGQPAEFSVDAYPSVELRGEVESLSAATGSRFTLLPPDNASGNFTKVVQRVPVRVHVSSVPPGIVLRPGMSVDLKVDTRS